MKREAIISSCGRYRFRLARDFRDEHATATCLFVLNNPSVADANIDDRTAGRGVGFTRSWGYGRMLFGNTNPYRSTDPSSAIVPPEAILQANDAHLTAMAEEASMVVVAWGGDADLSLSARALEVLRRVQPVHALAFTKAGVPRHLLYLRGELIPQLWKTQRR